MAWITPTNLSTGCLVSAAMWNQATVANVAYLKGQAGPIEIEDALYLTGLASDWMGNTACPSLYMTQNTGSAFPFQTQGGLVIQPRSNTYLTFGMGIGGSAATAAVVISPSGGVGIGVTTTAPGARLHVAGPVYFTGGSATLMMNDTSNANNDNGLTINQIADDDEIISLKSSDVAHGLTGTTETDTYGMFRKYTGGGGGLDIWGLYDTSGADALVLHGARNGGDTAKNTGAYGWIRLEAIHMNGTAASTPAINTNLVVISSGTGTARFIFDSEGDFLADAAVSASAYDSYNDAALLRSLDVEISDPATVIESRFKDWTKYNRTDLERSKLVTFNEDGHHFVNYTKLARAQSGAVWQLYTGQKELHERIDGLEKMLGQVLALLGPPKGE